MVFSFCMINAIFVVAIFLLQSQKDVISITWPYPDNAGNPQKLEPLALLFMVLFVGKKQHALKKYDHFPLITGLLFWEGPVYPIYNIHVTIVDKFWFNQGPELGIAIT